MISTKDLSGLPNAERLKNFCKGLEMCIRDRITDELMVVYFDLNQEIFCITHES